MKLFEIDANSILYRIKRIALVEVEGNQKQVANAILPEIEIRGIRFWFLLCSCMIASIGLNTGSAAVIIGAMLVSPLMGPILGLGFGLATRSRPVMLLAARNLSWAVAGSLVISTLYFWISPLDEPTAEIVSRSAPTLLDLFVAVASAFAGVIALSSRSTASIVPGVAIATAIMPPLCTAGYGIAQGSLRVAGGAFYLFFVNALAISLVAFLLFKRMNFRESDEEIQSNQTLSLAITGGLILFVVAPLGWTLHQLWKQNSTQIELKKLIQDTKDKLEIVNWQYEESSNEPKLVLYTFKSANSDISSEVEGRLKKIAPGAKLIIRHGAESDETRDVIARFQSSPLFSALSNQEALSRLLTPQPQISPTTVPKIYAELKSELAAILGESIVPQVFVIADAPEPRGVLFLLYHQTPIHSRAKQEWERRIERWYSARRPSDVAAMMEWRLEKDLRSVPNLFPPPLEKSSVSPEIEVVPETKSS